MPMPAEKIHCDTHGETPQTFVCSHLVERPVQRWHCAYPTPDSHWPDAWCDKCNRHYAKEGEWNKHNEGKVRIRILCSGCYESRMGQSVACMPAGRVKRWESFSAKCCKRLTAKQHALIENYRLNDYERWDWDQKKGQLIFSNNGAAGMIAKIAFIGSLTTTDKTWLWAWANFSLLRKVRTAVVDVRDFGESRNYSYLTVPKWPATETHAFHMAAITAHILGAEGIYRTPGEHSLTYMALQQIRKVRRA